MERVTVPTACTLDAAPAQERIARWTDLAQAAQLDAQTAPGLLRVRYRASERTAAEVRSLAALERECCAFLDYDVETDDEVVTLTVVPSPGAADDVAAELAVLAGVVVLR